MIHANRDQYPVTSEPVSQWARISFPFLTVDAENGGAIIKTEVDEIRPIETHPKDTIFWEHDRSVYSDHIRSKAELFRNIGYPRKIRYLKDWTVVFHKHID